MEKWVWRRVTKSKVGHRRLNRKHVDLVRLLA